MTDLRLDWCSYEAAKYAVEHWHYSGNMQPAKTAKIGVWENGVYIGAVLFSPGSGPIGNPYHLTPFEVCELERVALNTHITPVSKIVSVAIRILKKEYPKLRLIVSFADPFQNHYGGIYQAMNWLYTGKSEPSTVWIDVDGNIWHGRSVSPSGMKMHKGELGKCKKTGDMAKTTMPGKHRYLYPLDDEMRKQIEPLRKPYPKRGQGETDSAAQSNVQTGGASPTCPLLICADGETMTEGNTLSSDEAQ